MAAHPRFFLGISIVLALAGTSASGQVVAPAASAASAPHHEPPSSLRPGEALITLDYQVIRVPGDAPIDLAGLHVHHRVADGLYLGAGVRAPLLRGVYGGFTAFDIGGHVQRRLGGPLFATAGLSGGGGGGGRSIDQSRVLSGSGGFFEAHVGLGWDFGPFAVGANLARMRFRHSVIDSTQAQLFLQIPYTYVSGPFASQGQPLSASDARLAAERVGENMLSVVADTFRQRAPSGTYRGSLRVADLQYAHFFAPDTYWYAGLGVGYRGLPLYNQVLGGVGQRWRLTPRVSLYGQLGVGSGGYAPEEIDTASGLLVYPRLSAEYALSQDLGLALSVGYLSAPKGSSRNQTYGLALTRHLRPDAAAGPEPGRPATWQGFRLDLFQQTETHVRYRGLARERLPLIGIQVDTLLDTRWYVPVQAAVASNAYLGYPGYGELLAGLGVQSDGSPGSAWQAFGQLMAGSNVHGPAVKGSAGLRYLLRDSLSLQLDAGRIEARGASGQRFSADSLALGLAYRFAMPVR